MAQGSPSGRARILSAGRTDVGRRRGHNEDTVLLRPEISLFVVADGMGGHNAGEVASALAARSIENYYLATRSGDLPDAFSEGAAELSRDARRLAGGARKANADVYEIASTRRQHAGMGSTLVAASISEADGQVHICHAGDSRCYRIREGAIEQLTRDHSLINDALAMKPDLTPEMLAELPKNVITRAIGTQETLEVDLRSEPLVPGDLYLLCSDGLSGLVTPEQMLETSELTTDLEEMCDLLIIMANEAGGIDNISVVLFRVEEFDGVLAPARHDLDPSEGVDTVELDRADEDSKRAPTAGRAPGSAKAPHEAAEETASPEPRESGVRVVERPSDADLESVTTDIDELEADFASDEELARLEAEMALEQGPADVPVIPEPLRAPPSVPPPPVKRGPPVEVRKIVSIGVAPPSTPAAESIRPPPAPLPSEDGEVLVCTTCGAEALVGNRFCVECGTRHEPRTSAVVRRSELPKAGEGQVEVTMDETDVPLGDGDDSLDLTDDAVPSASPAPPSAQSGPTYCHNCGAKVIEDYSFCVRCGSRVR